MIFLTPVIVKCMEKNLDVMKPRYSKHILSVPWPFIISRFYCSGILLTTGLVWPASSDKIMVSRVPKLVPVSFTTEGIKELEAHLPQDCKQSIKVSEHYFMDSFPILEQPVKIRFGQDFFSSKLMKSILWF